ncbi:MAG: DUF2834 domain-containing protein [Planctomycetota bacterium]|nr:DUF2834 domain-containing protein [Planctomycetota bacterium]
MKYLRFCGVLIVLVAFTILSRMASVQTGGFIALWALGFSSIGNLKILIDLMIACVFAFAWMWHDAQKREATVWPFFLITLGLGSFGPLAYLLLREWRFLREPVPNEEETVN